MAHVWDAEAHAWWRFDDETVSAMPLGPTGEHGDHGVAAEKKVRAQLPARCPWGGSLAVGPAFCGSSAPSR